MIVIDTSVLIDALHGKEDAIRKVLEMEEAEESLCTTQANVLELCNGVYSPTKSEKGLKKVKALLDAFVVLPIDDDAYDVFGELSAELKRRGESIGDFDELIAAIALVHGATMVSSDGHFRRVPGLKIDSA